MDRAVDPAFDVDAKQALRLRRFSLATFSYVLATALVAIAWAFGVLPARVLLEATVAFIAINLGLYWAIRSGFNLRFKDPSLTQFQILAAITVLMYIIYHMEEGREVALFGCFIVFLFGIFRLKKRDFIVLTLYTLAVYALVINLLMHLRPAAIHSAAAEWMAWLGLAGFLPCFIIIGEQINGLRLRMRASEARFRNLTLMSSDFFWESDAEHRILNRGSANWDGRQSVFGRGASNGERRWEVPYLSPDEAGWRAHRAVLDAHQTFRDFEFSRLGTDGTERHISICGDPVFDGTGGFHGYRGVGTEITQRKRAEAALRKSSENLRLFADNIPAMAISLDQDLRCRFANRVFAEYFQVSAEDIVGKHLREIIGEEMYREIERHYVRALQGHPGIYQRIQRLDGETARHFEVRLLPDVGEDGKVQGCFALASDITEHKNAHQLIQRVAHHDSLTGLPNRLLFNDRLDQLITAAKRQSRQVALLYLDLNLFKPVNDEFGHAAGDELLKLVAAAIRRVVRESDTVARVGGDEFTVILPDVKGRGEAQAVADKITEALATPFELGTPMHTVQIGVSIGIAIYPTDARDTEALIKAADASMYKEKRVRVQAAPIGVEIW